MNQGWLYKAFGVLLFYSSILSMQSASAFVLDENRGQFFTEYLGITDAQTRQAPYRVVVPDNWNGKLLMYARGTGSLVKLNANGAPIFDENGFPALHITPRGNSLPELRAAEKINYPEISTRHP